LKLKDGEVGSSTMPHKVNPIDFENSEGNLGLSNSLMSFFADKLTKSRLQRDLSDSTVLRNLGVGFGYSYLGITSCLNGLSKIQPNNQNARTELADNWQVLAEALQIVMKLEGYDNAYEEIKTKTRGQNIDKDSYLKIVDGLKITAKSKDKLKKLTPLNYLGIASKLAKL
jgi:adenylosuccinate lyase